MDQRPFAPAYGTGISVSPTAAAAETTIGKGRTSLLVINNGSVDCFVRVGTDSRDATTADCPILAGNQLVISKDADADKFGYITSSGTGSLKVIEGEGGAGGATRVFESVSSTFDADFDATRVMIVDEASIVDTTTTAGVTYYCEALPGSSSAAAVWKCSKLTHATGVTTWADGDAEFDNIADNRATLTYS
jgi:hypothetical protein